MKLKDRIKGLERIPARDLLPHPRNWRTHPREQRDALRGILAEVGIADALLVRRTKDGYQILDGHCRAEEAPDVEWPCLVVDLSDAEAEKLLVTHDPIGAMAEADAETLRGLLDGFETENEALAAMIGALELDAGLLGPGVAPDGKEYDETIAEEVKKATCPACGHEFPI
jgi:ParB-like chromosome segregation protein Spo0J